MGKTITTITKETLFSDAEDFALDNFLHNTYGTGYQQELNIPDARKQYEDAEKYFQTPDGQNSMTIGDLRLATSLNQIALLHPSLSTDEIKHIKDEAKKSPNYTSCIQNANRNLVNMVGIKNIISLLDYGLSSKEFNVLNLVAAGEAYMTTEDMTQEEQKWAKWLNHKDKSIQNAPIESRKQPHFIPTTTTSTQSQHSTHYQPPKLQESNTFSQTTSPRRKSPSSPTSEHRFSTRKQPQAQFVQPIEEKLQTIYNTQPYLKTDSEFQITVQSLNAVYQTSASEGKKAQIIKAVEYASSPSENPSTSRKEILATLKQEGERLLTASPPQTPRSSTTTVSSLLSGLGSTTAFDSMENITSPHKPKKSAALEKFSNKFGKNKTQKDKVSSLGI